MSLPPSWTAVLQDAGWEAMHWSEVGHGTATDAEIMDYAANNGHIVITHDLDFGTLLALTAAAGPSVIQVRTTAILPRFLRDQMISAIRQFEKELSTGALITIDPQRARARVLPIRSSGL